ncbi:hypothetical protein E2562_024888 [Oryza meyeriana var. granulata]|uniref:DUF834 domain-containing protein n=1 Tax=Oryza meyeriana var. granulata TaxID=110450 RepID=A0A6G1DN36_9ORYZ|nr:hypothetical protein E2562_024888 [Oryza meyeriana var. granulata]
MPTTTMGKGQRHQIDEDGGAGRGWTVETTLSRERERSAGDVAHPKQRRNDGRPAATTSDGSDTARSGGGFGEEATAHWDRTAATTARQRRHGPRGCRRRR